MSSTVIAEKLIKPLKFTPNYWTIGVLLVVAIVLVPICTIVGSFFFPDYDTWHHLRTTVLKDYISNSLILMLSVSSLAAIIGVVTAWLTSMCDFTGKKIFQWLLLLPLAMPAYIIAFTYTGILEPAGPVQTLIRDLTSLNYNEYWFPEIRSLGGAILMLSLVLYPYVYMLTRAALLEQSVCVLEVSRTLGCGPWRCLLRVAIPLARPAIIVGITLVSMETLADYGTVKYFGISTFTTGIFRTWFGLNNLIVAAQLAAILLSFILMLILIERWSRHKRRYHHTSNKYSELPHYKLKGINAVAAFVICLLPFIFGFAIPAAQLLVWSIQTSTGSVNQDFILLIWHSLWLATITAIIAVGISLFLAYAQRLHANNLITSSIRATNMGYAIPGAVIAVGVIIPFAWFDNQLDLWFRAQFNFSSGLLLSGSIFILIFAYLVRFLSISTQTIEAGFTKIKPTIDNAARSLNKTPLGIMTKIHLPIMKGTLLTALLLVFVDVLKELPATLVLRPFDFNTLAVSAFELASDERLSEASTPALAIVFVSLIPVILLSRSIRKSRPGHHGK